MVKILMTADAVGGVWGYALELAAVLRKSGFSVMLAVMGGGVTAGKLAEAAALRNVELRTLDCKLEWMDEPLDDVSRASEWLLQLADEYRPDVVHLNGYAHAALSWNAPIVVVAHSCVCSWFRAVRKSVAPPAWDEYRRAVQRGLLAADLVIAPSHAMLHEIVSDYGPLANTRVILNGRDPDSFSASSKEDVILAAGRVWDDAKNFQTLDSAAAEISWPVYVAGEPAHPSGGAREMPGLHLLGALTPADLKKWYSRAAIFALPSLYEPFGLAALEAALSGCALVLSRIPSLQEIWGDAAVYVDPEDREGWRDELNRFSRDAAQRATLASAASLRARELTAQRMTSEYIDCYQRLRSSARQNRPCASLSSVTPSGPIGIMGMPTFSAV